jgi:catechol 2,3-dioxygenase-like lactoylglutathione lyase family enzyme
VRLARSLQEQALTFAAALSPKTLNAAAVGGSEGKVLDMQHQISVITLGISDLKRSRRFYAEGFGWTPVFENEEIIFYQMNGFVLGTFERSALEKDMSRPGLSSPGAFSLAHNVPTQAAVDSVMDQLVTAGGSLIRAADAPPHGGYRGYVADPDEHAWEIAWNPAWPIDNDGHVTFAI